MDTQEYEKLVRKLELDSEQNPQGVHRRVMLISVMAYLVLALLLILLSGLVWFGISRYSQIDSAFLLFKILRHMSRKLNGPHPPLPPSYYKSM